MLDKTVSQKQGQIEMLSASMRDMEDKLYKAHGQIKTQTKEVNTLIKQKEQMEAKINDTSSIAQENHKMS